MQQKYPDLIEEYDVDIRIMLLRERLAKKEIQIARYYSRILKPESAMSRYKYIINNYNDTIYYGVSVYKLAKYLLKQDNVAEAEFYLLKLISDDSENKYVEKTQKMIDKYKEKKEKTEEKTQQKTDKRKFYKVDKQLEEIERALDKR